MQELAYSKAEEAQAAVSGQREEVARLQTSAAALDRQAASNADLITQLQTDKQKAEGMLAAAMQQISTLNETLAATHHAHGGPDQLPLLTQHV